MRIFDKILFVLLAIPSLCFAGSHSVQITRGVVTGGTTEPETGAVILGTTTTTGYTEDYPFPIGYEELFNRTAVTATWAETASTTTLSTVGVYLNGFGGGNCKVNLRASDLSLIATSQSMLLDYEVGKSFHEFTFSSPPTVTKGSSYIMAIMCDADSAVMIAAAASGIELSYGTNGSYASPAATLAESETSSAAIGPFYGKH